MVDNSNFAIYQRQPFIKKKTDLILRLHRKLLRHISTTMVMSLRLHVDEKGKDDDGHHPGHRGNPRHPQQQEHWDFFPTQVREVGRRVFRAALFRRPALFRFRFRFSGHRSRSASAGFRFVSSTVDCRRRRHRFVGETLRGWFSDESGCGWFCSMLSNLWKIQAVDC